MNVNTGGGVKALKEYSAGDYFDHVMPQAR